MIISAKTAARIAARHLPEYRTIFRGTEAYLCEDQTRTSPGAISQIVHTNRLVCPIEPGDNIFGLRHTRAMRIHDQLDEEMQRRIHAPTKEREYSADQASQEFREHFVRRFK